MVSWLPIGPAWAGGAVIPFDRERFEYGESEGHDVAGDVDQAAPDTAESRLLGEDVQTLAEMLSTAPQNPRPDVFPDATC